MHTYRSIFVFVLLFATLFAVTVEARPPRTELSNDQEQLQGQSIAIVLPITAGKQGSLIGWLGKVVNIPQSVQIKDIGFLFNAMDVQAFQVSPDEAGSFHSKTVLPYLLNSKEMQDSLKLRRTARQIKFQVVKKVFETEKELPKEAKEAILKFLSQQVGSPMVVLAKSPLPKFIPEPGPCMIPIGMERLESKTGKSLGLETSAICVIDIKSGNDVIFSVKDAVDNDTLDLVLCHENAHAIMFDMYGKVFKDIQRTSTNGHDAPLITDQGLAFIEGWAEAFEAVYGPANPKLKEKDRKKYNISEFLFGRQDPIRRDRYIWAKPSGKKTGVLKNASQLMATEGVIAGQFYDILTSRKITAPFEKCVTVMLVNQPKNYMDFFRSFVKMYPDDAKVLTRILLENMNYITMDAKAMELYRQKYEAQVAFKQKKIDQATSQKSLNAWNTYKSQLFAKAEKGADVFANVGPQLWFSGKVAIPKNASWFDLKHKMMKKMGLDKDVMEFRLDLNTITAKALKFIGFDEAASAKFLADRDQKGFFKGNPLDVMKTYLGDAKFQEIKAKCQLAVYVLKVGSESSEAQMAALWPEDLERLPEAE